jgi:ketosteroid isomerase-like protein
MHAALPEQEVGRVIREMYRAFTEHRPKDIEAALHEDCTIWDVFTPQLIRGRAERDRFHEADQAQSQARGPLTLSVDEPLVSAWGDVAVARYYLDFRYEPPNAVQGRVRITSVLRREGGTWRIVHHHEGLLPGGVPPLGEPTA